MFLWHVWKCAVQRTNNRFKREEKGKGKCGIVRKPWKWVPLEIVPNGSAKMQTRATKALVAEYERQRENDEAILGVLVQFPGDSNNIFSELPAPESQHTVGSMDTSCNINLWEAVFREEAWRSVTPITKQPGFDATHPGGHQENGQMLPGWKHANRNQLGRNHSLF